MTPAIAYILLWFPKPSETFIFREVVNLRRLGMPVKVFTLYGPLSSKLSFEMRNCKEIERLGIGWLRRMPGDIAHWWRKRPDLVRELFATVPVRRWRSLEQAGENLWSFLCGFSLARFFEKEKIRHIHSPWANGPATAAWVASRLTGIPFSFTARAGDIYPQDGALSEKIRDAMFVRSDNRINIDYLAGFAGGDAEKFLLTYNGVPLAPGPEAPVRMGAPLKILAVGRFVPKKGFDLLLRAAKVLDQRGVDFHVTLAGAGPELLRLKGLARKLGLTRRVSFPGFIPHDRVADLFSSADVFVMPCVVHSTGDRDGIPTVIMEALLHRVPVVATDVCGISEVIRDRETGLLIPQKDFRAIAGAIMTMLKDRDGAIKMAENGRAFVLDRFDPEKNHRNVFDIYCRACS